MKTVFCLFVVVLLALTSFAQAPKAANSKVPVLSDKAKFELRDAQLNMVNASRQFQEAQAALNKAVADAYSEAKVKQADWTLQNDLTFLAVPKPKKEESQKDEAKK